MKRLLLFVLVLSILLLLLFINTVRQPSLQPAPKKTTQVVIKMEEAAQRLSSLLQFPSISTQMDDTAFSAQTHSAPDFTVYDGSRERWLLPALLLCGNDIKVGQQQKGFQRGICAFPGQQLAVLVKCL